MKRHVCRFGLVLTALAGLGLAVPAAAGAEVPFSATGAGYVRPGQGNTYSTIWSGQASHLGGYQAVAQLVNRGFANQGSATLGGANGDSITMFLEDRFDRATGRFLGTYRITGGTGRFRGSTGSGTYIVVPNFAVVPTTFTIALSGTINY